MGVNKHSFPCSTCTNVAQLQVLLISGRAWSPSLRSQSPTESEYKTNISEINFFALFSCLCHHIGVMFAVGQREAHQRASVFPTGAELRSCLVRVQRAGRLLASHLPHAPVARHIPRRLEHETLNLNC